jgi:dTDP-4-amino-4,6-dideoxygalactose transaminase
MEKRYIPLAKPYFGAEELELIKEVLDSGWVTQGPKVKTFESMAAEYLGINHTVAVCNCTAALHLSLLALGISKGDEVIVADFTFPATGHSVMFCGAKPVFIDINPRTYNIDPILIEEKITPRTKAIIPVHTFGQPADMDNIMKIAWKHDLKVIEDAACAFGAKYKNRYAGTIGDIGCFSFHARKGITTGEGGMVVTCNKEYADKIRMLSMFGMESAWDRKVEVVIPKFSYLGYNYKMSDITAAIGIIQLKKISEMIERRRYLAEYWDKALSQVKLIDVPYRDNNCFHIFQSYVAIMDKNINRNQVMKKLLDNRIQTQIGTYAS